MARGTGPKHPIMDGVVVCLLILMCAILLVATPAWRTFSEATGIGDPNAGLSDLWPHHERLEHNPDAVTIPTPTPAPSASTPAPDRPATPATPSEPTPEPSQTHPRQPSGDKASYRQALNLLDTVPVAKARPGGYDRESQFGGWQPTGCGQATTRDAILARDLTGVARDRQCRVTAGMLHDPYTGRDITFTRGRTTSAKVQIDHVVALLDAYASGARDWPQAKRVEYANSADVLVASDGPANMAKGVGVDFNGTARYRSASNTVAPDIWLPDNTAYQCDYMAHRARIKHDWALSMTAREKQQTVTFLAQCAAE